MGQTLGPTKYRITSTQKKGSTKKWKYWEGLCAEVTLKEKVKFDNGEKYSYIRFNKGLRLTEGPHTGFYDFEEV